MAELLSDKRFVLCGGDWVFCDENCACCVQNLTTTTNTTITTSEYKIDSCGNVGRSDNGK